MEFFHCNSCYRQPDASIKIKYYLTSCGHSFCANCINAANPVCKICHSQCKLLTLSKDLPEDIKLYFCDSVERTTKVLKLILVQLNQCKIYMEDYAPRLESKYKSLKQTLERKNNENEMLKKRINALTDEIQKIKSDSRQFASLAGGAGKSKQNSFSSQYKSNSFYPSTPAESTISSITPSVDSILSSLSSTSRNLHQYMRNKPSSFQFKN